MHLYIAINASIRINNTNDNKTKIIIVLNTSIIYGKLIGTTINNRAAYKNG